tara:strand:- start:5855 stop:6565 length:711 start_codon:yes stop_codon:yes gene_type:complete
MKILLSIVSHNQRHLVERLLFSLDQYLKKQLEGLIVCVTENDKKEIWENKYKKFSIYFIRNVHPKGFADNHNSAFSYFSPDIFLVVNPDIVFFEEFDAQSIVKSLTKNSIASPIILNNDMKREDFLRKDLTPWDLFKRKVFKKEILVKNFDWMAGMFLIFDGCLFEKLKGFDTRFFLYVEDCDICIRAKNQLFAELKTIDNFSVQHLAQRDSHRNSKYFIWHLSSICKYWIKKLSS